MAIIDVVQDRRLSCSLLFSYDTEEQTGRTRFSAEARRRLFRDWFLSYPRRRYPPVEALKESQDARPSPITASGTLSRHTAALAATASARTPKTYHTTRLTSLVNSLLFHYVVSSSPVSYYISLVLPLNFFFLPFYSPIIFSPFRVVI